jgi:DNA-directed RNA polymerase specialized sigma24 family protein
MQGSTSKAHPASGTARQRRRALPDLDSQRTRWEHLVQKLRAADAGAAGEWVEQHWRGVWLLLRRRLGASATPDLARTALAEAVTHVRTGEISRPSDLVAWVHGFACQFQPRTKWSELERQAEDEAFPISSLVDALRDAGAKQREALRRHYLHGESLEQLGKELGIDKAQFLSLQMRLRALGRRKPAAAVLPVRRTAGAA